MGIRFPRTVGAVSGWMMSGFVLATEWEEFRALDLGRLKSVMAGDVLMDGRNLLKSQDALTHGFTYLRVGRLF